MKKIIAIVEQANDGFYSVYADSDTLPFGVCGEGQTVTDAVNDFKKVFDAMKKQYETETNQILDVELEFQHNVRSFLQYYYNFLTLAGLHRLTGINQGQLSQYVNGTRHPSPATTHKIETAIHQFGNELRQVALA